MDDRSWIIYFILVLIICFQMKRKFERQMLIDRQAEEISLLRGKLCKPEYKIPEISIPEIVGKYLMLKVKAFVSFLLNKMKEEVERARTKAELRTTGNNN